MSQDVKISVLMSVYNPKKRGELMCAVQSVLNQTFRDWEMLLYDDGSEEPYIPMIREAASLDPRIRYIRGKKNRGLAHAMNVCLGRSKGRYIARMDSDDISKPERFRKMYRFMETHPEYGWVGCNAELFAGSGVWGTRVFPKEPGNGDFLHYSPYVHPAVLFRRELLEEAGGYRELMRGEDYELFMRLHAQGLQGYNIQETLFQYREDAGTYRHRKYRYQIEEVGIRKTGFQKLGILNYKTWPYVLKPLLVGLIPYGMLVRMKIRVRKEIHVERFNKREAGAV